MEAAVKEDRKRKIHDVEHEPDTPNKKSIVDSWSRISSSSSTQGRGCLVGWVKCPLCEGYSKKKYAIGRGLANHLKDVHTPWKPSKMAQKIHRRKFEANEREKMKRRRVDSGDTVTAATTTSFTPLEAYEATPRQMDEWNAKMLEILRQVEQQADVDVADVAPDGNASAVNSDKSALTKSNTTTHFDSNSKSVPYRDSLPSFLKAAADGNLNALREAVEKSKKLNSNIAIQNLVNTKDRHNSTADHWAAGGGHVECLKYLYELRRNGFADGNKPPSINQQKKMRRRDGKTCLHYAARNGHNKCIRFVLEQQNQHAVDEPSGDGTTPLHLACYGGHYETVKYLIEQNGANVHAKNEWGCTCAHWVAMTISKSADNIKKLCNYLRHEHKVSFVEVQGQGHTALHKAAHRDNRSIVEWMAQSKEQGGAGLTQSEKEKAGAPDQGGHRPSDIWRTMNSSDDTNEEFADWMSKEMGW